MAGFDPRGVEIERVADPAMSDPVLVEGLPGVGYVGKLAVEHLLGEGDGTLVRRIFSEHLPPQVTIDDAGVAVLSHLEVHHAPTAGGDLLLVVGDQQSQTSVGYYRLTDAILDIAESFGAERVYALGGVPTGEFVDEYSVLGAVSDPDLIDPLRERGVEFRENEPAGGVVGISGLLLGMGGRRSMAVSCLMGETSGYLVDPQSANRVLHVLEDLLGLELEYEQLDARADRMETVVRQLQQLQETGPEVSPGDEDLRYID